MYREKRRNVHSALLVLAIVLISSLGLVAAACGGGDSEETSLETYFESVKQIMDDANMEADEVEAEMNAGVADAEDLEAILDVLVEGLDGFQQLASDERNALEAINAPAEIDELHSEFVAIFSAAADALESIGTNLAELDSAADDQVLFEQVTQLGEDISTQFGTLGAESNLICFELQDVADENEIDIDLECGDTE